MKNQPFETYNDSSGNVIDLYFNFRFKGSYGSQWSYYPFSETGRSTHRYASLFFQLTDEVSQIPQSNTGYTEKTLALNFLFSNSPARGSQIDFQVQTMIGHIDYAGDGCDSFVGEKSDWSNTQTITVGDTSQATTNPTANATLSHIQPTRLPTVTVPAAQNSAASPTDAPIQPNAMGLTLGPAWTTIVVIAFALIVAVLIVVVVVQQRSLRRIRLQIGKKTA